MWEANRDRLAGASASFSAALVGPQRELCGQASPNRLVAFSKVSLCVGLCGGRPAYCAARAGLLADAVILRVECPDHEESGCGGTYAGPPTSIMRHLVCWHSYGVNPAADRVYSALKAYIEKIAALRHVLPCSYGCGGLFPGARELYHHLLCRHNPGTGMPECCHDGPVAAATGTWVSSLRYGEGGYPPLAPVAHGGHEVRLAARRTLATLFAREEEMLALPAKRGVWGNPSPSATPAFTPPFLNPEYRQSCRPVTLVRYEDLTVGPYWSPVSPSGPVAQTLCSQYAGLVQVMADTAYLVDRWVPVLVPLHNRVFGLMDQACVRRYCDLAGAGDGPGHRPTEDRRLACLRPGAPSPAAPARPSGPSVTLLLPEGFVADVKVIDG